MANWFGKGKRGLIMGVWNAHTSVGEPRQAVCALTGADLRSCLFPACCFDMLPRHVLAPQPV